MRRVIESPAVTGESDGNTLAWVLLAAGIVCIAFAYWSQYDASKEQ